MSTDLQIGSPLSDTSRKEHWFLRGLRVLEVSTNSSEHPDSKGRIGTNLSNTPGKDFFNREENCSPGLKLPLTFPVHNQTFPKLSNWLWCYSLSHIIFSMATISFQNTVYLDFIPEKLSGVKFLPVIALAFPVPDSK